MSVVERCVKLTASDAVEEPRKLSYCTHATEEREGEMHKQTSIATMRLSYLLGLGLDTVPHVASRKLKQLVLFLTE
jgi:hypothetical protein